MSLEEEDGGVEGELGLEPLVDASAIAKEFGMRRGGVWAAWGLLPVVRRGSQSKLEFFL